MFETKIRKVGNSAVVTLSQEVLSAMDVKEGNTVFLSRTDDGGVRILAQNPELASGACMTVPIWVPLQAVYIIHDSQIARHGGASGLRDETLLESACSRPQNKFSCEQADIFQCGTAYAFVDGNKRTVFVAATFLRLNGWAIKSGPAEGVQAMEHLATDALSEDQFCEWLKKIATPVP